MLSIFIIIIIYILSFGWLVGVLKNGEASRTRRALILIPAPFTAAYALGYALARLS